MPPVRGLVLKRDVGTFTMIEGTLYSGRPLKDRTNPQLLRYPDQTSLEQQFRTLILLFADSTFEELRHQVSFSPGSVPKEVDGHLKYAVQFLTVPTEPVEVVFNYLDSVLCGVEEVEW